MLASKQMTSCQIDGTSSGDCPLAVALGLDSGENTALKTPLLPFKTRILSPSYKFQNTYSGISLDFFLRQIYILEPTESLV